MEINQENADKSLPEKWIDDSQNDMYKVLQMELQALNESQKKDKL